MQTKLSDANGFYSFDFDLDGTKNYVVIATKDGYINNGINKNSVKKPVSNVTLNPYAYFRLRLIGNKDAAYCGFSLGEGSKFANLSKGNDSTYIGVCEGNVKYQLTYATYDFNYKQINSGSVFIEVPAFDTSNVKFEF